MGDSYPPDHGPVDAAQSRLERSVPVASEPINWREMSPAERDGLIHEKVMKLPLHGLCTGLFIHGSRCEVCGFESMIYADHPQRIPSYTTSMDATLAAIEQDLDANVAFIRVPLSYWRAEIRVHDSRTFEACADTPQEAYWLARLRQRGCEVEI